MMTASTIVFESITIAIAVMALAAACVAIYLIRKNNYELQRLLRYQDGATDIQSMFKQMMLEHHTMMEQTIIDNTQEIIRYVTYTLRWQKVTAKMIKSVDDAHKVINPKKTAAAHDNDMHALGLEIAEVAFDEKKPQKGEATDKS